MSWSGGVYTKGNAGSGGWAGDAASGIGIEAGRHDTQDNDFATGINQCLNKDGSNAATGNLNLNSNKITNLANASASGDAMAYGQIRNGTPLYLDTANNRLGIGTTTPIAPLDIAKSLSGIDLAVTKYESGAQGAILHLRKSKNDTIGNNTIVTNGDALGEVYFMGANGSGYTVGASIVAQIDGTPGASNDMPGRLIFSTTPDGSGSTVERMRINNGGGVMINTTSEYSTALSILIRNSLDGGIGIQANTNGNYGMIFRNSSGSQVGRIQIDAAGTQYVTTSDYRLKTNVAPMLNGLGKILQLKPCTWDWVNGSGAGQGFIAHELQSIIPEAVSGEKDAVDHDGNIKPQGVDASFVVATTVAAIQQLNDKVEALEARIAALES